MKDVTKFDPGVDAHFQASAIRVGFLSQVSWAGFVVGLSGSVLAYFSLACCLFRTTL
jgi:hypothetical protein